MTQRKKPTKSDAAPHGRANLHALTPHYDESRHRVYFDAIQTALSWTGDKVVRNIALTGSYGVGKSSILNKVAADHVDKVIQISLSTLGVEPKPGEVADEDTKTNRIQKEIVKQLLYTQDPVALPGSRYRRTTGLRLPREIAIALLAAIPLTLILLLTGLTDRLIRVFAVTQAWTAVANGVVFFLSALFTLGVRAAFHNKIRVDSIGAGSATIKLSEDSPTYFDEYLDEIVYFFEKTKRNLVIFEDIDRFGDPHIFETLRALNTILNGAKQLDGRTIRFIYAIKDSIFEDIGTRSAVLELRSEGLTVSDKDAAVLEIARANRTKFFDVVIPVVPFITHQTARELLEGELGDLKQQVSPAIIDLAAQHLADMRLLINIRNEFLIFHEQVIGKSSLKLSNDNLLAMVLYKSTHLTDFELIKLGRSNLDRLYRESRDHVRINTERLNVEIRNLRHELSSLNGSADRAKRLGERLGAGIDRMAVFGGLHRLDLIHDGASVTMDELKTPAFWQKYAAAGGPITVHYRHSQSGWTNTGSLSVEDVQSIIGERVVGTSWDQTQRDSMRERLVQARADVEMLKAADMAELVARPDLTAPDETRGEVSFRRRVSALLNSRLAQELIAGGYIGRNFTLYTATFVGARLDATAMNYVLKTIDAGQTDAYFSLTASQVKAILDERRQALFRDRAAYNFDVVDYLLANDQDGVNLVIGKLAAGGQEEKDFLRARLGSERPSQEFVKALASQWRDVLQFLVKESGLEGDALTAVVDDALSSLSQSVEYTLVPELGTFLESHASDLDVLTSPATPSDVAARLAATVSNLDVLLPDLSVLGEPARRAIVEVEAFTVTRGNLGLAAGGPTASLALDILRFDAPHAYRRALSDLEAYLRALETGELTISDRSQFEAVLEDVAASDIKSLPAIVAGAVPDAIVEDIATVRVAVWPVLARQQRVRSTFANVAAYVAERGVDENLVALLAPAVILEVEDVALEDRVEIAKSFMAAVEVLPSPETRARLARRLNVILPPTLIPTERGPWVGWLIHFGVLKDEAPSFGALDANDWPGLEFAMEQSQAIASFLTPELLPKARVADAMRSGRVDDETKTAIVRQFSAFSDGASRDGTLLMAQFARSHGVAVTIEDVQHIASVGADRDLLLELLEPLLGSAQISDLRPILKGLGEEYVVLSEVGSRRPKVANTPASIALLERLKALGTVNQYKQEGSHLRVSLRH